MQCWWSSRWCCWCCWRRFGTPPRVPGAALLGVVAPSLLALLPLHVTLLGLPTALLHLLFGGLLANVALNIAMLGFRTLPFASSYAGGGNLKGWMPVSVIVFLLTYILAAIERVALSDWSSGIIWALVPLAAIPGIRMFERRQRESYGPVDFYELPGQTQRLDLSA